VIQTRIQAVSGTVGLFLGLHLLTSASGAVTTLHTPSQHLLMLHSLSLLHLSLCMLASTVTDTSAAHWWQTLPDGCRVFVDTPVQLSDKSVLVIYATPNGNTIEQTLGAAVTAPEAWRFQIQHVAAQIHRVRQLLPETRISLAVIEAPGRSWPSFLGAHPAAPQFARRLAEHLRSQTQSQHTILCGHSGGGAFLLRCIHPLPVPSAISRFVFLDANYSWDNNLHSQPLLQWLQASPQNQLITVAYDDRQVELNGRRVVSDDGGTWRASERMIVGLGGAAEFAEQSLGPLRHLRSKTGQVQFLLHTNPQNQILHTALVGDMHGLICSLTADPAVADNWQRMLEPRDYSALIPPAPRQAPPATSIAAETEHPVPHLPLPARTPEADGGTQVLQDLQQLPRAEREHKIIGEFLRGNIPRQTRRLVPLQIHATTSAGRLLTALCFVTSDCLAIGSEQDSVQLALTPATAATLAEKLDCLLITPRISDAIYEAATVRLTPQPMTENRESLATLLQHQSLLQQQLLKHAAPHTLVAGAKKDLVLTRRLLERPGRVALYGWHQPDGLPIQPLYTGHSDQYVDYSHGIRLIHNQLWIDGQLHSAAAVLANPELWPLLSREGPLDVQQLVRQSQ